MFSFDVLIWLYGSSPKVLVTAVLCYCLPSPVSISAEIASNHDFCKCEIFSPERVASQRSDWLSSGKSENSAKMGILSLTSLYGKFEEQYLNADKLTSCGTFRENRFKDGGKNAWEKKTQRNFITLFAIIWNSKKQLKIIMGVCFITVGVGRS